MEKIKLGTIVGIKERIEESFQKVKELKLPTCQLACVAEKVLDKFNPAKIGKIATDYGVEISSCFLLFEGQIFNLKDGPKTMGFIPPEYQKRRLKLAKEFSDWIKEMRVSSITCHVGFVPDDERNLLYKRFIELMKEYTDYCAKNNQVFCFETGQELPSTLKRAILDIGNPNLRINFDPANLILYGMANPLDAVEIFGEYVEGMHAKDGVWPNRDEYLGGETPLGEGKVDFSLLIPRLKMKGFKGPITIEREISGPQQKKDILRAIEILKPLL